MTIAVWNQCTMLVWNVASVLKLLRALPQSALNEAFR